MKTHRSLVVALGVLAAFGVVRAATSGWQERRAAVYTKADAERKKQGLEDQAKLYAKYPTPEVSFAGQPARLCPGKTATVKLTGKFVTGTSFIVTDDSVQVLKEKATPTSWEAQLQAAPNAMPDSVAVDVITPVSAAMRSEQVLNLGCKYQWHLELSDGQTLDLTTDFSAQDHGGDATVAKSGKMLGTLRYGIGGSREDFNFTRQASQQEFQAAAAGMTALYSAPEFQALQSRQQKAADTLGACKDPKTMAACMKGPAEEMRRIGEEQQAMTKKFMSAGKPNYGCQQLNVKVTGGTLSGEANECGDTKSLGVKGTVKAL